MQNKSELHLPTSLKNYEKLTSVQTIHHSHSRQHIESWATNPFLNVLDTKTTAGKTVPPLCFENMLLLKICIHLCMLIIIFCQSPATKDCIVKRLQCEFLLRGGFVGQQETLLSEACFAEKWRNVVMSRHSCSDVSIRKPMDN